MQHLTVFFTPDEKSITEQIIEQQNRPKGETMASRACGKISPCMNNINLNNKGLNLNLYSKKWLKSFKFD